MNLTKPQKLIYDMDRFAGGAISVICGSMLVKGEQNLDKLQWAVNEIYRLNDALRIRIRQEDGQASQQIMDYTQREVDVLRFDSKAELDAYAEEYAKVPIDLYGDLCSISLVLLPGQYGVLVKFHHMVGDAWTIALIGTQFNKLLGGEAVECYSYADYVDSEQAYLQSSRYEKDRAFFLEQFQKCDEVTYLNEKQSDTRNACRRTFVVNFEQTRQLVDYAKEHGSSAFVLFTAALAAYMSRIKMNAEKFYIGTAVLNRSGMKEKNTMGMFVNTVPMLMELDNSKSFAENLDGVQKTAFSIFRHQKHNYGDVLAAIRKEYGFSETLYDVMISYQNAAIAGADVETTWYFSGSQNESLQIHIDDRDSEGIFRIHYDYLTDKFTADEIDMLHQHICTLLFDAIQNDAKKLPELELLTVEEEQKLLYDFNDTAVDYPRDKCVHQLFEEQVLKTPDKTAVIACDKTLTYAQLNEEANRIAHSLIAQGVGVEDIVAFALQRKSYLISTILGILKTGAAYLPVDPDYPQERIDYMLQDSKAKLFVTEDNIASLLANSNTENPHVSLSSENLCYCIYTSGSTGRPKGTLLKHSNLVNLVLNRKMYPFFESVNRIALLTTICFDVASQEIFTTLLHGLCGYLFPAKTALSSDKIAELIVEKNIEILFATPTYFDMLTQDKNNARRIINTVKIVVLAGEQFYLNENTKHFARKEQITFQNQYGPAETHVVTYTDIEEKSVVDIFELQAKQSPDTQKLLLEFNNTAVDYPKDCCVHQMFEEQVAAHSNRTAVVFKNIVLSYADLAGIVQEYADKLVSCGIQANDVVAVHMERSHKLIAFQLAVLKIGAVFLPVDKRYPVDRIEYVCTDCNVKLFISDKLDNNTINANVVTLAEFEGIVTNSRAETVNRQGVCYIIYTSGSTGNPKGCMLTNQGLFNFCKNNNTLETLRQQDSCVFACVNSVSFDYFIAESLLPLTNGFTTVILDDNESTNQERFLAIVEQNGINVVMTTPTRLKIYYADKENCHVLEQLQCICTSGEPLTPDLLVQIYEKSPKAQIYNPLGPSECSVWVVGGKLEPTDKVDIHIGKPIANTQIYIVDQYLQPTPIGVTGELCIAGDGVGAGYLNRPELTAEKFIDNPFGKGKLYKTGDLAYWREDGNIVYVGRNDFQVKIRGLRIELGEIEHAICGMDGISQAVVVVRKNSQGRQLICAFYVGTETDAKDIRAHIGKKLPKYMLPHICTRIEEMPLTSSGKVNRKALPEVDLENIKNDTEFVPPETERQRELCRLLEVVLGTAPVGIEDDFFDLGGDSLKAIEFVSKAHNEGVYFDLQGVFDHPTVKGLCEHLENGDKQEISFADVDFTAANTVLEKNRVEYITAPNKTAVGNILLAGATGYLGIHVLANFLDQDTGTAYCLVRGKDQQDSNRRLQELLQFYFGDKYADTERIEVVCADLQKDGFALPDTAYTQLAGKVDTVINCAASVKHYGSYKYFYEVNVEATKRLIAFCERANAKLIHTSTVAVSGNSFNNDLFTDERDFQECDLYIGQPLENVYARSKFEAERAVIEAMAHGLQANIMRMGNLMNRASDGVFQKNYETNAFLKRVRAMVELGAYPESLAGHEVEFTPIDEAAEAIMTIARHFSTEQNVFHLNNSNYLALEALFGYLRTMGCDMKQLADEEFDACFKAVAQQEGKEHILDAFINDLDQSAQLNYHSNIQLRNDFTVQYLKGLGFEWSDIGLDYVRKYVEYFKKIGYMG